MKPILFSAMAVCLTATPAMSQTSVDVREAELAVPFGAASGQIVLVGEHLVFVDGEQKNASFAVDRANMTGVDYSDQMVTITTRTPVRDRTGPRSQVRLRLADQAAFKKWYSTSRTSAPATPLTPAAASDAAIGSYQARHDHRIGGCQGRLIITADRLAFESIDEIGDSRQWVYADIKEIKQDGPYQLEVTPFVGNTYNLELIGTGLDSRQYRMLVDKVTAARMKR